VNAVTAEDIQNARFKWIRTVNALSTLLDMGEGISEEIRIRILQPLLAAEVKFAKKKRVDAEDDETSAEESDDKGVASAGAAAQT